MIVKICLSEFDDDCFCPKFAAARSSSSSTKTVLPEGILLLPSLIITRRLSTAANLIILRPSSLNQKYMEIDNKYCTVELYAFLKNGIIIMD